MSISNIPKIDSLQRALETIWSKRKPIAQLSSVCTTNPKLKFFDSGVATKSCIVLFFANVAKSNSYPIHDGLFSRLES